MTRRRDVEKHRHSLDEIRDIMNSMKNLSYMEERKIGIFLDAQHAMVKHIETVAQDFLSFYPETLIDTTVAPVDVYLLIGSERGFCGDFNHAVLNHFKVLEKTHTPEKLRLITVGHKLETLLEYDERPIIFVEGASVADEIDNVINQIVNQLTSIQEQHGSLNLFVLYHDDDLRIINQQALPPFQNLLHHQSQEAYAPELNLEPRKYLLDLSYHYLFIVLYEILNTSLMAECHQRVAHLEGAVQQMDEQSEELRRQGNVLRQEEIIEEIEVILLSATSLDEPSFQG